MPEYLEVVHGDILDPACPIGIRSQIAGDHNFTQRQLAHVPIARWGIQFLRAQADASMEQKVAFATRSTGMRRFQDTVWAHTLKHGSAIICLFRRA